MNKQFHWIQESKARLFGALFLLLLILVFVGKYLYKIMYSETLKNWKPKGEAPQGLQSVAKKYGVDFARDIERALRQETAHFTSGQWLKCGSAGMEASHKMVNGKRINNDKYPFGWGLEKWIKSEGNNLSEKDFDVVRMNDAHTGADTLYIKWRSTGDFVRFFAWHIKTNRGGRIGYWNSLIEEKALKYEQKISKIDAKFI